MNIKSKREYYKDHVDRRVRLRKLIYLVIILTVLGVTLYDSFTHTLPFHYILFFFVGSIMARILTRTLQVTQNETDSSFTVKWNATGVLTIILVVLLRIGLFPEVLTQLNVVYVSDALLLIVMGWFIGRMRLLTRKIEDVAFSDFLRNRPPKTSLPPENEFVV